MEVYHGWKYVMMLIEVRNFRRVSCEFRLLNRCFVCEKEILLINIIELPFGKGRWTCLISGLRKYYIDGIV
jgi:hypothetical protein